MPARPDRRRAAPRLLRGLFGLAVAAGLLGRAPRAQACAGIAERIVGYSWQQDEYVVELSALDGGEPSRYVTRRLSTGDVVDDVTCPGAEPCTATDALGLRACWYRALPKAAPHDLSLDPAPDDAGASEVRLAEPSGAVPLFRVRGTGTLSIRAAVRVDGHLIVFVTDTVEPGECGLTHERAVVVVDPDAAAVADGETSPTRPAEAEAVDIDLDGGSASDPEVRVAPPLSPDGLEPLTMAARAAAAVHLDALAGCWAQEALSIIGRQSAARAGRRAVPDVEVEAVRVIVIGAETQIGAATQSDP